MADTPLITCWTTPGKDIFPNGMWPLRPTVPKALNEKVPMPSTREPRHVSWGFPCLVERAGDRRRCLVLVAPVEPRFDHDALVMTLSSHALCGSILLMGTPESLECKVTENAPHCWTKGRLRRMSFAVDRKDLLERFGWVWTSKALPSLLAHIAYKHLGFPVIARHLWIPLRNEGPAAP